MRNVRLAIVGCGRITEDSHLPAALKTPGVEVAALVDSTSERGSLLTRMYGLKCKVATDLDSVLDDVDGVVIATPNHTHVTLARAALGRGRPVLVEKPLTTTYADAVALCALARERASFISVGFMTRHYPVVGLMQRLLTEGALGEPRHFSFEYGTKGGWAPHSGYNLRKDQSGGGVLVVSGTHFIDRMLAWFGYPVDFRFADDSHGGVEANCKAWLQFPGGLTGELFFSKTMSLNQLFVMHTERYRIEIPWSERRRLRLWDRSLPGTQMTLEDDGAREISEDCFQTQIEEFARVIRDGGEPTVNGEAGAASVKLCEELYAKREQLEEPWVRYDRMRALGV